MKFAFLFGAAGLALALSVQARPVSASGSDNVNTLDQPAMVGSLSQWLTDDDYPPAAEREGRHGRVGFRLTLNSRGRVTDCQITASTGHADLDGQTCRQLIRRGRFVEQHTSDALRYFQGTFVWKVPAPMRPSVSEDISGSPPQQPRIVAKSLPWVTNDDYPPTAVSERRQGRVAFRLTLDSSGRVTNCQITASSGHADLDDRTCRVVTRRGRFVEDDMSDEPRYFESALIWGLHR